MLQINFIRENQREVIDRLKTKNFDGDELINKAINADNDRKKTQQELDNLLAESNSIAKQIGDIIKQGKTEEATVLKERTLQIKEITRGLQEKYSNLEKTILDLLLLIPNLPSLKVPKGKTPEDNEIIHSEGIIPEAEKCPQPHWELCKKYDIIDFELGVKITGAGFPVYKGKGAKLQRSLISFFLDQAIEAGYREFQPPLLVNEASAFGTGQLPDKEGQMYHVTLDNLFLIPTSEVPVTNLHRDTIVKAEDLPLKNTAYSQCFRREAGSYGKDVRGLNRLHQFDKVEIVQIVHPEKSYEVLETMKDYVAGLLRKLELPYRIAKLCGGDMSFASALTYDMEVFSAAQQKWLEVSSVSNFEAFQANRLKLRYKEGDKKPALAHTLNGSALALPRIVASLLENNQTPEGIKIPAILVPYTGFSILN